MDPRTRWLVTGAGGQLATAFEALLEGDVMMLHEDAVDLRDARAVKAAVRGFVPDVILHTAAYTDVDGAEADEETAFAVNALGTRNLVEASRGTYTQVVSFSTDYVFDGAKGAPYVECDEPAPLSAYGRTKLAQEHETLAWVRGTVIRTAWLYSPWGRNFVKTILGAAREKAKAGEPLRVVDDQVGSPTYAAHLAAAVLQALRDGMGPGIYHMAGGRAVLVARAGGRGGRAGRPAGRGRADLDRRGRPPRTPAGVLRARQRARRALSAGLERRRAGGARRAARQRHDREGGIVRIVVTGGAGFIGSNFVRRLLREHSGDEIVVLDKLTYAGNLENLRDVAGDPRYRSCTATSATPRPWPALARGADAIVNFAAETHVDRSHHRPRRLHPHRRARHPRAARGGARARGGPLPAGLDRRGLRRRRRGLVGETDTLRPSSPYSASKAGADLLVLAYSTPTARRSSSRAAPTTTGRTSTPRSSSRCSSPTCSTDEPVPVYGDGRNVRDWIHVEDHCAALDLVLPRAPGEVYNVGGGNEVANIDLTRSASWACSSKATRSIRYGQRPARPRPALLGRLLASCGRLGWSPVVPFEDGLAATVAWYRDNRDWWRPIKSGELQALLRRAVPRALGASREGVGRRPGAGGAAGAARPFLVAVRALRPPRGRRAAARAAS